ncbi:MAG: hypothetical protein QOD09_420 [Bradyrhizobium sp.]|jgi:hypothetical protein|nr:hypothetical protein [Bradyrhizobium sp.]
MQARIFDLSNNDPILAGSNTGRRMFNSLWELAFSSKDHLFVLDFSGIRVVTWSFVREAVVVFRKRAREELPHLYPVLTNLSAEVEEEVVIVLNQMGEAFWCFNIDGKGRIRKRRLLGRLDPKLQETLDLIDKGRGFDAATLWKSTNSTESVGVTAWNNRLASLSKQGLVFESKVGKQKSFRPLHESTG